MDWGNLLIILVPIVVSFLLGLAIKSPIYQKGKAVLKEVSKALEDDKITAAEVTDILNALK